MCFDTPFLARKKDHVLTTKGYPASLARPRGRNPQIAQD